MAEALHALIPLDAPATRGAAAARRLREAIISGALAPGTILKDLEVATHMGLSPVPLREAMVQLAAEGLVEIAPNRWKRVAPLDHDAVVELLAVQQRIWEIGYEWGAPHLGKSDLLALATIQNAHSEAITMGDINAAVEAAMGFHLVFMRASGNRELFRISIDRLPLIRRFVLLAAPDMVSRQGQDIHSRILDAMRRCDIPACLAHFRDAGTLLLDVARAARDKFREKE